MSERGNCPACGGGVVIHTASEGTSHMVPAGAITVEAAARLARALADEIGTTAEAGTAGLIEELVRRPGAQGHRSILLGHESGWLDLVWRAVEVAELADEPPMGKVFRRGKA